MDFEVDHQVCKKILLSFSMGTTLVGWFCRYASCSIVSTIHLYRDIPGQHRGQWIATARQNVRTACPQIFFNMKTVKFYLFADIL